MSHARAPGRLATGATDDPVLGRLGELAARVPAPQPLPREALDRVRDRLLLKPASFSLPLRPRTLVFAIAALVLAGAAVASFALSSRSRPARIGATPPALPAEKHVEKAARPSLVPPPPASTSAAEPAPPPVVIPPPRPAPSAASPASLLAEESRALEPALTALRRERNPQKALVLLDAYASSFPHGTLGLEARVARVDAHLALGQKDEALALLERLPLERVGRGGELRLVRAELRAARDPASALRDFDTVLASGPSAAHEERALHGRATARTATGDVDGARADAARYLAKYPNGRFAPALGPLAPGR
jgi:hypothetical protein